MDPDCFLLWESLLPAKVKKKMRSFLYILLKHQLWLELVSLRKKDLEVETLETKGLYLGEERD